MIMVIAMMDKKPVSTFEMRIMTTTTTMMILMILGDANEPLNSVNDPLNVFAALDSVQKKVRFCLKLSFCAILSKI